MGPTHQVIGRALRRVGRSSIGDLFGRAVTLILLFVLLRREGISTAMDEFCLALAVGSFLYGTLANVVVIALVPDFVYDHRRRGILGYIGWTAVAGLTAGVVSATVAGGPAFSPSGLAGAASIAVMGTAGMLAAPAAAALYAAHRYLAPGLSWGLRLLPVSLYLLWPNRPPELIWLLAGLALADAFRAAALLWLSRDRFLFARRGESLRFLRTALPLILAAAIAGLSPVVARWIASLGEAGGVSTFEAADRIYGAIASAASTGTGSVLLVYLARLDGTPQERDGWRWVLVASLAWSLAWLVISILLWALMPTAASWFGAQNAAALGPIRNTYLALTLGLPAFIMTGVLGRRLLTQGYARSLVTMATAGMTFMAGASAILYPLVGTPGIGLSIALSQYLVAALMIQKLIRRRVKCES